MKRKKKYIITIAALTAAIVAVCALVTMLKVDIDELTATRSEMLRYGDFSDEANLDKIKETWRFEPTGGQYVDVCWWQWSMRPYKINMTQKIELEPGTYLLTGSAYAFADSTGWNAVFNPKQKDTGISLVAMTDSVNILGSALVEGNMEPTTYYVPFYVSDYDSVEIGYVGYSNYMSMRFKGCTLYQVSRGEMNGDYTSTLLKATTEELHNLIIGQVEEMTPAQSALDAEIDQAQNVYLTKRHVVGNDLFMYSTQIYSALSEAIEDALNARNTNGESEAFYDVARHKLKKAEDDFFHSQLNPPAPNKSYTLEMWNIFITMRPTRNAEPSLTGYDDYPNDRYPLTFEPTDRVNTYLIKDQHGYYIASDSTGVLTLSTKGTPWLIEPVYEHQEFRVMLQSTEKPYYYIGIHFRSKKGDPIRSYPDKYGNTHSFVVKEY